MFKIGPRRAQLKSMHLTVYFISVLTAIVVFLYLTHYLGLSLKNFKTVAEITLFAGLAPAIIGVILIELISKKKL